MQYTVTFQSPYEAHDARSVIDQALLLIGEVNRSALLFINGIHLSISVEDDVEAVLKRYHDSGGK